MNKIIINAIIASLALLIFLPVTALSQEKKVHVKTVKVVDGEKVVTDTIYTDKDGVSEKEVLKTFTWVSKDDSASTVTIDLDIDSDIDFDSEKMWMVVKSGKDGNVKMTHGNKSKKYVIKIDEDDNGEQNVYIFNDDSDFFKGDLDELHEKLEEQNEHLEEMRIELDGEKIIMLEEFEDLKELKELELLVELDEIEDMYIDMPDMPEFYGDHDFIYHEYHENDFVSDKELRDAGIKNKVDRLDVVDFNIDIDNGIVDLGFELKTDGDAKVIVFNYFGDKVFTGKPELMNGKYFIKIDLSAKQHGTYFLQVIQKNCSFTKKLRL